MKVCFECGREAEHEHHPIPRSLGGKKTIPLCRECHGLIHELDMSSSTLIKLGQAKARSEGKTWGNPRRWDYTQILFLFKFKGLTQTEIALNLGVPTTTVHRIVHKNKA